MFYSVEKEDIYLENPVRLMGNFGFLYWIFWPYNLMRNYFWRKEGDVMDIE